jgi:hypothetical protein
MSLEELRIVLAENIRGIQSGEVSAANANAISNATGKILSSVKLELEYARLLGRKPSIPMLGYGDAAAS